MNPFAGNDPIAVLRYLAGVYGSQPPPQQRAPNLFDEWAAKRSGGRPAPMSFGLGEGQLAPRLPFGAGIDGSGGWSGGGDGDGDSGGGSFGGDPQSGVAGATPEFNRPNPPIPNADPNNPNNPVQPIANAQPYTPYVGGPPRAPIGNPDPRAWQQYEEDMQAYQRWLAQQEVH